MDLGLLGGLAEGLQQGTQAYIAAKDRARKQTMEDQQLELQRKAEERAQEDQGFKRKQVAAALFEKGIDDSGGDLAWSPEMQRKRELENSDVEYGLRKRDAESQESKNANAVTGGILKSVVPEAELPHMSARELEDIGKNSLAEHALVAKGQQQKQQAAFNNRQQMQENSFNMRDTQLQKRQDFQAHQKTVSAIKNDPVTRQRLTQYQNLSNSLSILDKSKNLTPQQIAEFQQSVRSNMGIKGGGGVGERENTYITSIGLDAEKWKQFITGDPAEIAKDNKIVQHLRDLAHVEQDNIKNQYQDQLDFLSEGNSDVYERNPQYKKDLERLAGSATKRMTQKGLLDQEHSPSPQPTASQVPVGGTMVKNGVSYIKTPQGWVEQ